MTTLNLLSAVLIVIIFILVLIFIFMSIGFVFPKLKFTSEINIKGNKTVQKKDGKFTLSPKYKYFKNTQKFIGYIGTLRYVIKSENAKDLNKFIDDLINLENT